MTTADLLLQNFDIETSMTRRLLERVPTGNPDWTPHPKSMPIGRLAMHIATLPGLITACLQTPEFDLAAYQPPDLTLHSREHLLSTFDRTVADARLALAPATEQQLAYPWRLRIGDRILFESPRALTVNHSCLGHLIHHRAQLGTYLRALDLPVPGVYGPSADDRKSPDQSTPGPETPDPGTTAPPSPPR